MYNALRSLLRSGVLLLVGTAFCGTASFLAAQEKATPAATLTIDTIFAEQQFKLEPFTGHWQDDSQGFELIR